MYRSYLTKTVYTFIIHTAAPTMPPVRKRSGDGFKKTYPSFEEARDQTRALNFKTMKEYVAKRPLNLPSSPHIYYKTSGWKGNGDFLGTHSIANFNIQWPTFEEARAEARMLGCRNVAEYNKRRPAHLPSNPNFTYARTGWSGYGDFLGTNRIAYADCKWPPFDEARNKVHSMKFKSMTEYRNGRTSDLPSNPHIAYRTSGWTTTYDWLGTQPLAVTGRCPCGKPKHSCFKCMTPEQLKNSPKTCTQCFWAHVKKPGMCAGCRGRAPRKEDVWRSILAQLVGDTSAEARTALGGVKCDMRVAFPDAAFATSTTLVVAELDEGAHSGRSQCDLVGGQTRMVAPDLKSVLMDRRTLHRVNPDPARGSCPRDTFARRCVVSAALVHLFVHDMVPASEYAVGLNIGYLCYGDAARRRAAAERRRAEDNGLHSGVSAFHVMYDFSTCDEAFAHPVYGPLLHTVLSRVEFYSFDAPRHIANSYPKFVPPC